MSLGWRHHANWSPSGLKRLKNLMPKLLKLTRLINLINRNHGNCSSGNWSISLDFFETKEEKGYSLSVHFVYAASVNYSTIPNLLDLHTLRREVRLSLLSRIFMAPCVTELHISTSFSTSSSWEIFDLPLPFTECLTPFYPFTGTKKRTLKIWSVRHWY